MASKNDMKPLVKAAEKQGWNATLTKNGHWRLKHSDGRVIFMPQTPSDSRSSKNARALMRRYGIAC